MSKILILYSTVDGHTRKICERLREVLEAARQQVVLASLDDDTEIALEPFDKVVIGASIRYGRHRPSVAAFLRAHQAALQSKPNAFFSVNKIGRASCRERV